MYSPIIKGVHFTLVDTSPCPMLNTGANTRALSHPLRRPRAPPPPPLLSLSLDRPLNARIDALYLRGSACVSEEEERERERESAGSRSLSAALSTLSAHSDSMGL